MLANAGAARAAHPRPATVPLDAALTALARATGTEIVGTDPGLHAILVRPPASTDYADVALKHLLADTPYRAVLIGPNAYRIVRRPAPADKPPPVVARSRTRRSDEDGDISSADVVVTATKRAVTLQRFPGAVTLIEGGVAGGPAARVPSIDDLSRVAPVVQTTQLGPGRDKLFIRGIADSSFNGATQSTASVYFGDIQLGYSGPEPGLALVDLKRVEILEGPQGTLYGAGAIGGIVRLTPNPVDLTRIEGAIELGTSQTLRGGPGVDASAHLNMPVIGDMLGLRIVGYGSTEGGYIDDIGLGRDHVNTTRKVGGRLALRFDPGNGWSIDASVLDQQIDAAAPQYGEVGRAPLIRRSFVPQPYSNSIALGRLIVTKTWDSGLQLVSATGYADTRSTDQFDASPSVAKPMVYRTHVVNHLLTEEGRISRAVGNGNSWVAGFSYLDNDNAQQRAQGAVGDPPELIGVTNFATIISLFGETTLALTRALSVTGGVRGTSAREDADPSITPRGGTTFRGRTTSRVDPTLALSWLLTSRLSAFARGQTGYRTGGLAVARGLGRVAAFEPDTIQMGEIGLRLARRGPRGLELTTAVSYARWDRIQADLVARGGLPYTANIGNARITTVEGTADWVPLTGLHTTVSALFTSNTVTGPLADTSVKNNRRLPQTPPIAGNATIEYRWRADDSDWRVGMGGQYVGRSVLGTGDLLDISQGRYATLRAAAGWTHGRWDLNLAAENLTDSKGNQFSLGNPFSLAARNQLTPLRPLTIRLGTAYAF